MKRKRYVRLNLQDGAHHYVLLEGFPKTKKTLNEEEAKRTSKKEASNVLFMVRE
jgi:hypothetical protein